MMTNKSWEIIIAGLVFIGISIFLMNREPSSSVNENTSQKADSLTIQILDKEIKVIALDKLSNIQNLENLKNLTKLESLKNLDNLENLKNLEKLKVLGNFMPEEVKADFITEIDNALREIDNELVDVQIDLQKGLIAVEAIKDVKPGTWNTISPGVYAFVKEWDATGIKHTSLEIPFGSITVTGSDDQEAKLVIQASGKVQSAASLNDRLNKIVDIDKEHASFKVSSNSSKSQNDNIHLQAILTIPKNSTVSMDTEGGHIEAAHISGNQRYHTKGGHITLKNLNGEIHANTGGGHISISDSEGKLDLKTRGGHIKTLASKGDLVLETSGGNIDVQIMSFDGAINANTGAGTVMLSLPKQIHAHLKATGNSVEIDSIFEFTGSKSSDTIDGDIGNGGLPIHANSRYGKVIIRAN